MPRNYSRNLYREVRRKQIGETLEIGLREGAGSPTLANLARWLFPSINTYTSVNTNVFNFVCNALERVMVAVFYFVQKNATLDWL